MNSRPRPALIVTLVLAGLSAVVGFAGLTDLIPERVGQWLMLLNAVGAAMGGVYLQSVVTPLSAPVAKDGRPLVPSPPAEVPPGTPERALDATQDDGVDYGTAVITQAEVEALRKRERPLDR